MNVKTTGAGGPDAVLLHGIPGSSASWAAVAEDLASDHRVHVPDLLGFGASPRPRHADELAPAAQAAAVAKAIDAKEFVVVGHDYGGPVALTLAAAFPHRVKGVVLASTNAFPDTPVPFPLSLVHLPYADRILFSRASLRLMIRQGGGGPDPAAALGDGAQVAAIRTIFAMALRRLRELYAPVEAALRSLQVPVEVVWGARDPFFGVAQAERTAAAAPGSPAPRILAGAGHFLPEQRPAELAAAARRLA